MSAEDNLGRQFGYHIASLRHRASIEKEGLKPQDNPDYTPGVYAMENKEGLEHYVGDSRRNADIYRVTVPVKEQESDPNMPGAFFTRTTVTPDRLKRVGSTDEHGAIRWHE